MKNNAIYLCLICLGYFILTSNINAQSNSSNDWAQFRGNNKDGISTETGLLKNWAVSGPKQVWKTKIGSGFSEITVFGDQFYTMYGTGDTTEGYEFIAAYEVSTGKQIWNTEIDTLYRDLEKWGDGPRSTQAVDEKHVYGLSGNGKLAAVDIKTGEIKWKIDLIGELGSRLPRYGYSSSPILFENVLILEVGGSESRAIVAFDPETGKILWNKCDGRPTYNSPTVAEINGKKEILFANDTMLHSFNSKGNINWSYRMPIRAPYAMPLFVAPNKIFISAVSRVGSFLLEVKGNTPKEIRKSTLMKSHWSSSCYKDGYIYGFSNAKLQCINAETGEVKWGKRGFGKGSMIMIDNKIIVLSDKGVLVQVDAKPEMYSEMSRFQALKGKSWTAPSFSNGKIFLRNLTEMACFNLKDNNL
jgi:outer membrane protein assembly factor BamB